MQEQELEGKTVRNLGNQMRRIIYRKERINFAHLGYQLGTLCLILGRIGHHSEVVTIQEQSLEAKNMRNFDDPDAQNYI